MSVIDDLLALQEQDLRIKELKREITDLPNRRKEEKAVASELQNSIQAQADQITYAETKIRNFEADVSEMREKQLVLDARRNAAGGQKEYAAANREYEILSNALADKERRIEQARIIINASRERIEAHKADLAIEEERIRDRVQELNLRLIQAQSQLIQAEEERKAKVTALDVPEKRKFLVYYERLSKKFWPVLMRVDTAASCPGCHMQLTASKLQEAQRNAMLADNPAKMKTVACDYCGRLLFK